jgi:hypothetical protein
MGKVEKLLQKMRDNPRDWRIEELKTLAKRFGVKYQHRGTSHVTFRWNNGVKLTVPAHKPIKPVYIKQFITILDEVGKDED